MLFSLSGGIFLKAFFATVLSLVCLIILIIGNIHWEKKTDIKAYNKIVKTVPNDQSNKGVVEATPTLSEKEKQAILKLASHWPEESQQVLETALEEERPFKIVSVGSDLNETDVNTWPLIVSENIIEQYGNSVISFKHLSYDLTSTAFVEQNKQTEIVNEQADLVLFEPFTLKDNGVVVIEDSHKNIKSVINEVEKSGATVILQPPHPLHNANFYPIQVNALQQFAVDNNIPYLNHWTVWPDPRSDAIKEYLILSEESTIPSEIGHALWAQYLTDYFIAKE